MLGIHHYVAAVLFLPTRDIDSKQSAVKMTFKDKWSSQVATD
jgi:hypothetical protein